MNRLDSLDGLCAKAGMEPRYHDVWGQTHEASEATRMAILRELGEKAGEDPGGNDVLPPVVVVHEGRPPGPVALKLPEGHAPLEWWYETEAGATGSGEIELRGTEWTPPEPPDTGYHVLGIRERSSGRELARTRWISCPARCHLPAELEGGRRLWGLAIQLYAVRSSRNWGMGDFGDLKALADVAAASGAAFIGLNPLHALDPARPAEASPYSPSSRAALNVLYIDVEAVPDFDECAAAGRATAAGSFQSRLRELRDAELVDYPGVAGAKLAVLEILYRHFRENHLARVSGRADAFRAFQAARGESLRLHALFDALQERLAREGAWGWPAWPEAYRDVRSEAVAAFGREHAERVEYFEYLQWLADSQLGEARRHAAALGLPIGFYQDLAVGASPGGAETWSRPGIHARGVSIGAPPDDFNLKGQDWGLVPVLPRTLPRTGYEPFVALLRAVMRHAGALRIDHVMGLMRLYWVPGDAEATDGAYVNYPFEDLLGIVALESRRHGCLVIGEDLGTVPERVRREMDSHGILSYRPLYFERSHGGAFKPPGEFARAALVTVSTHDLPTLQGFWRGADLELRDRLDLYPSAQMRERMIAERARDRDRLREALAREGFAGRVAGALDDGAVRALHEYIARTPSMLMAVQMEDVLGQVEQVNMPSTWGEAHPNWRRKLALRVEDWRADPRFVAIAAAARKERRHDARPRRRLPGTYTVPRATYRMQFSRNFRFLDAARQVPYLAALGISHIYASSYLKARPGSAHGYDVVDHNAFNPEIGTQADFELFVRALQAHGMGQMLDLVPNHMGVLESDNAWWLDVLENGPASRYAGYFDIEWEPANPDLRGKVLLPVLGRQYGEALESGELKLGFDAARGELSLAYFRHRLPIDPREYPAVLEADGNAECRRLAAELAALPPREEIDPGRLAQRARDKELHKRSLAALCARDAAVRGRIEARVAELNGRAGEAASFDALHRLIEAQAFRLAHWRVAADDINYRRFFDINDLAALRMESESVFEDTHRLVMRLVAEGSVEALRIDHPDGLHDPRRYFERLQARAAPPGRVPGARSIYVVVEKILASHERLPGDWPVDGTTGYRFANVSTGLFVDAAAEPELDRIYAAFIGGRHDYAELVSDSKRLIMDTSLASELNLLAGLLDRVARSDRRYRDFTLNSLRRGLYAIVAHFPVYRTYMTAGSTPREEDLRYIDWAVGIARKRAEASDASVYDFIRAVLAGTAGITEAAASALCARFVGRFQQFTAPVMAKATEDTVFYIYNRLTALNEVGGDPQAFGLSLSAFHAASADRAKTWPHTLLATSTHDNKRSEDVRARITVLSEMPGAWRKALGRWSRLNHGKKRVAGNAPAPSRNDEYLLYQTLVGAWPGSVPDAVALEPFRARIQAYMLKAAREAKVRTAWTNPDVEYEQALAAFVDALLAPDSAFVADFARFHAPVARLGLLNGLSQTAIKLTSPGVPDIYQGTELWNFSLVDPDNRRRVDYRLRARLLEETRTLPPESLLGTMDDGRVKLYLVWKLLALRATHEELFAHGSYVPLAVSGTASEHVCAYARVHSSGTVVTVAPRLLGKLAGRERMESAEMTGWLPVGAAWGDAQLALPEGTGSLRNELTGERFDPAAALRMAEVLSRFPVAVLGTVPSQPEHQPHLEGVSQ